MKKTLAKMPPRAVVEAMELHRVGRLEEAKSRYQALLSEFPNQPDLHYGLGFLGLQQGQPAVAVAHLEKARGLRPGDARTLSALGSAYLGTGQAKQAETQFAQAFRAQPSGVVAENWAAAARQSGNFGKVLKVFDVAARSGHATPRLQGMAAHAYAAQGDAVRAERTVNQAVEGAPNDPEVRHIAGKIASLQMNEKKAIEHLERAVEISPAVAQLHLDLAWAYIQGEQAADAAAAFRNAVTHGAMDALILRDCAIGFERLNLLDEAGPLAEQAARVLPQDAQLAALRATLARRDGRISDAHAVLSPIMRNTPPDHRDAWFEWARVLDGSGETVAAIDAFEKANSLWRARPNTNAWISAERKAMTDRVKAAEALPVVTLAEGLAPLPFQPIFLTGFPRSGTTLTDRILGAHSQVGILEERPLIEALLERVEERYGPYPACLPALSDNTDDINALRAMYADGVRRYAGAVVPVALDKHPINFWRVGLIRVLFPEAPIMAVRRHPMDTVLSCWQQNFFHTPPLSLFTTLAESATAYDHWHRIVDGLEKAMPLDLIDLSYERLAANPETTMQEMLPRLGLNWEDGMSGFAESTVAGEVVTSASYAQVGEKIGTKAVGRWKRYEKALSAVTPVLRPWCDRFGYTL